MNRRPNRATRRRLERETLCKVERIENETVRREIIQLHTDVGADACYLGVLDSGNNFVLRASPGGLTWGEREEDGFCSFEVYGPDGEHLYGYGGDGLDLETEVYK